MLLYHNYTNAAILRGEQMGRSQTVLKQYGLTLTKAIFYDILEYKKRTVIYEQYSYGQNGLVDYLRAITNYYLR